MRKRLAICLVLVMLLSLFPQYLFIVTPTKAAQAAGESPASLSDVMGEVYVKRGGGLRELKGSKGMPLAQGDSVRTAGNSLAVITFTNGSKVTLGPGTSITLSKLAPAKDSNYKISIRLRAGTIWNKVQSLRFGDGEYEIVTSNALMRAKGTLFLASTDPASGSTTGHVMEGAVGVQQGNPQDTGQNNWLLPMGNSIHVPGDQDQGQGQPPEPSPLDMNDVIKNDDPSILARIAQDTIERLIELQIQSQSYLDVFENTNSLDYLMAAIELAELSNQLADTFEQFMSAVEGTESEQQMNEILSEYNICTEELRQLMEQLSYEVSEMRDDLLETSRQAGISTEEIERILHYAPSVGADNTSGRTPVLPPPPNSPNPTSPPNTGDNGGGANPGGPVPQPIILQYIGAVSGSAIVGFELTAGDIQPAGATVTYQWMRSDMEEQGYEAIQGASSDSYTITDADLGKYIRLRITAYGNYSGTLFSNPIGRIGGSNPQIPREQISSIGDIHISNFGAALVGNEMVAGEVTPTEATVTYQWMRSDTEEQGYEAIQGASSDRYILTVADVGKYIRVQVTGYGDYSGTAISNPLGPVMDVNPIPTN